MSLRLYINLLNCAGKHQIIPYFRSLPIISLRVFGGAGVQLFCLCVCALVRMYVCVRVCSCVRVYVWRELFGRFSVLFDYNISVMVVLGTVDAIYWSVASFTNIEQQLTANIQSNIGSIRRNANGWAAMIVYSLGSV